MRRICAGAAWSCIVAMSNPAWGRELTADQIVDKALEHNVFGFQNAVALVTLLITNSKGYQRVRELEVRSSRRKGKERTLMRFQAPADVAGTGFLVIENEERDDDQYLYMPALGKVKRISGNQRNQRFMGTDLTYGDLESSNLRKAHSTRLADATVGGQEAYVVKSTATAENTSQYSKTITWIHKTSFLPLKVEFYDRNDRLTKTLKVRRLERRKNIWVVLDCLVENVQEKSSTQIRVDELKLDVRLDDSEFTQQSLSRG